MKQRSFATFLSLSLLLVACAVRCQNTGTTQTSSTNNAATENSGKELSGDTANNTPIKKMRKYVVISRMDGTKTAVLSRWGKQRTTLQLFDNKGTKVTASLSGFQKTGKSGESFLRVIDDQEGNSSLIGVVSYRKATSSFVVSPRTTIDQDYVVSLLESSNTIIIKAKGAKTPKYKIVPSKQANTLLVLKKRDTTSLEEKEETKDGSNDTHNQLNMEKIGLVLFHPELKRVVVKDSQGDNAYVIPNRTLSPTFAILVMDLPDEVKNLMLLELYRRKSWRIYDYAVTDQTTPSKTQ